jgi:hypothetical protein
VSSGSETPLGSFRWQRGITPSSVNDRGFPTWVFYPFLALVPTLSMAGLSSNG